MVDLSTYVSGVQVCKSGSVVAVYFDWSICGGLTNQNVNQPHYHARDINRRFWLKMHLDWNDWKLYKQYFKTVGQLCSAMYSARAVKHRTTQSSVSMSSIFVILLLIIIFRQQRKPKNGEKMLFKLLWLWLSDILFFVHHFNTDVIVATSSIWLRFKVQSWSTRNGIP